MARSRRSRSSSRAHREETSQESFERMLAGFKRSENRRGREFTVQPVSSGRATKAYVCPGCRGTIDAGVAHVVVWREDGIMGAQADLADRRHWHTHCWRIG